MDINRQSLITPDPPDRQPNPRRLVWILLILLLLVIVFGAVAWWLWQKQPAVTHTESSAVKTAPPPVIHEQFPEHHDYKGKYAYAGEPKAVNYPNPLQVLTNIGYTVGYDNRREDPVWVCYRLFKVANLKPPPRPKTFSTDMRTTARVTSKDYSGSGYDRGHDAPNRAIGVCYGAEAQMETFLMSNILPESKPLNEVVWEHLETTELNDYAQRYGTVWIITGPIFKSNDARLKCGAEIPADCYKLMIRENAGKTEVLAFDIPQTVTGSESPATFLTTVRNVEQATGLDFMTELPKDEQDKVETVKAGMW